jgi:hypothetical protein
MHTRWGRLSPISGKGNYSQTVRTFSKLNIWSVFRGARGLRHWGWPTVVQYSCMGWVILWFLYLPPRPAKKQSWHMSKLKHLRHRYLDSTIKIGLEHSVRCYYTPSQNISYCKRLRLRLFLWNVYKCDFMVVLQIINSGFLLIQSWAWRPT